MQWRHGVYLLVIAGSLAGISNWYQQHLEITNQTGNKTFPVLAAQINHRDGLLTPMWRRTWALLPSSWQSSLSNIAPPPPAIAVRILACHALAQFGEKARPLMLSKMNDPNDELAQIAMHGLLTIGISGEDSWTELTTVLFDKKRTLPTRRMALVAMVGLHWEEVRCFEVLERLARNEQTLLESLDPKANYLQYLQLAKGQPPKQDLVREQSALDLVKGIISRSFLKSLVMNTTPQFEHIAYYLASPSSVSFFRGGVLPSSWILNGRIASSDSEPEQAIQRSMLNRLAQENQDAEMFLACARHMSSEIKELALQFYPPQVEPTNEILNALFRLSMHEEASVASVALTFLSKTEGFVDTLHEPGQMDSLFELLERKNFIPVRLALGLILKSGIPLSDKQHQRMRALMDEQLRNLDINDFGACHESISFMNQIALPVSPGQLKRLLPLMEVPDQMLNQRALATYIRFYQGSFSQLMESILQQKFHFNIRLHAEAKQKMGKYLRDSETGRKEAEAFLTQLHAEIQETSKKLATYTQSSSPGTLPPASLKSTLEQQCHKRSWIFSNMAAFLAESPAVMRMLKSSMYESRNPNRIYDAHIFFRLNRAPSIMLPFLQTLLESSHPLDTELSGLIAVVGEEAVPVIEPLLRREDESIRLTAFRLIASILPEKEQHQIYLKTALDGISKPMAWQLESVSKNMETSYSASIGRMNTNEEETKIKPQ